MPQLDLRKPGKLLATAENAKDYTFFLVRPKAAYTKEALEQDPNCVPEADLIFRSQPVADQNGGAEVDLAPHAGAIEAKLDGAVPTARVVVVATARNADTSPPRLGAAMELDIVGVGAGVKNLKLDIEFEDKAAAQKAEEEAAARKLAEENARAAAEEARRRAEEEEEQKRRAAEAEKHRLRNLKLDRPAAGAEILIEKPGQMAASAENAKDYRFYFVLDRPDYTAEHFQANPPDMLPIPAGDVLFKSPATADQGGKCALDLAPHADAIKKQLRQPETRARAAVLATSRQNPNERLACVSSCTIKKGVEGRWELRPPMPWMSRWPRGAFADGKFYVIRARDERGFAQTDVAAYVPATNAWESKAPMPTRLEGLVTATVGATIHVIGYEHVPHQVGRPHHLVYDPVTNAWASKATHEPATHRHVQAAAGIGGKIYLFHGESGRAAIQAPLAYDPAIDTWASRARPPVTSPGSPAALAGMLYFVGQQGGKVHTLVYDPAADTWSWRAPPPSAPGVTTLHTGVFDGRLFAFRGKHALSQYDPAADNWTNFPLTVHTSTDYLHAAFASDEQGRRLYVAGGTDLFQRPQATLEVFIPGE